MDLKFNTRDFIFPASKGDTSVDEEPHDNDSLKVAIDRPPKSLVDLSSRDIKNGPQEFQWNERVRFAKGVCENPFYKSAYELLGSLGDHRGVMLAAVRLLNAELDKGVASPKTEEILAPLINLRTQLDFTHGSPHQVVDVASLSKDGSKFLVTDASSGLEVYSLRDGEKVFEKSVPEEDRIEIPKDANYNIRAVKIDGSEFVRIQPKGSSRGLYTERQLFTSIRVLGDTPYIVGVDTEGHERLINGYGHILSSNKFFGFDVNNEGIVTAQYKSSEGVIRVATYDPHKKVFIEKK